MTTSLRNLWRINPKHSYPPDPQSLTYQSIYPSWKGGGKKEHQKYSYLVELILLLLSAKHKAQSWQFKCKNTIAIAEHIWTKYQARWWLIRHPNDLKKSNRLRGKVGFHRKSSSQSRENAPEQLWSILMSTHSSLCAEESKFKNIFQISTMTKFYHLAVRKAEVFVAAAQH